MAATDAVTDTAKVQWLVDRREIEDVVARYCRGIDRMDEETLHSVFHEHAIVDFGDEVFVGSARTYIEWVMSLKEAFTTTFHGMFEVIVEVNGDTAEGESYFVAYHRFPSEQAAADTPLPGTGADSEVVWPEGGTELIVGGRYLDRFERIDGVWRMSLRRSVMDWCRTQPAADQWFEENPTARRGQRGIANSRIPA